MLAARAASARPAVSAAYKCSTVPAPPLAPIRTPTLILVGAHDAPSRLRAAELLAARLPVARCVVIDDAGHLPNLDKPARYSELCREFLLRHTPAGL